MVRASSPVDSESRFAARPVGAHSSASSPLARSMRRRLLTTVVFPTPGAPVISLRCGSARPEKTDPTLVEAGHGDGDLCLVQRPVEIDRSGYHVDQHARCAQEATQFLQLHLFELGGRQARSARRPRAVLVSLPAGSSGKAGRSSGQRGPRATGLKAVSGPRSPDHVAREASERATGMHDTRAHEPATRPPTSHHASREHPLPRSPS